MGVKTSAGTLYMFHFQIGIALRIWEALALVRLVQIISEGMGCMGCLYMNVFICCYIDMDKQNFHGTYQTKLDVVP